MRRATIAGIWLLFPAMGVGESHEAHRWIKENAPWELDRFYRDFNWPAKEYRRD